MDLARRIALDGNSRDARKLACFGAAILTAEPAGAFAKDARINHICYCRGDCPLPTVLPGIALLNPSSGTGSREPYPIYDVAYASAACQAPLYSSSASSVRYVGSPPTLRCL